MGVVGLHDLPPVRIEVGLGRDNRCHRADFVRLPDEGHLGFGELLAGVADHQHRVGVRQQTQRRRQVRLPVAADTRGVDEGQAVLEQRAAGGDLDAQHLTATGLRRATQVILEVGGRDGDHLGLGAVGAGHDQLCGRLLSVGHHGGQHRGLVVADAGHRHIQQRVEQLALALLELAGDHHPDLRIGDARPGLGQPLGQIAAVVGLGDLPGVVDQLEDDLHLAGVIGLRHGVPFVSACGRRSLTVDVPTGGDRKTIPASCAMRLCVGQKRPSVDVDVGLDGRVSWLSCVELSWWLWPSCRPSCRRGWRPRRRGPRCRYRLVWSPPTSLLLLVFCVGAMITAATGAAGRRRHRRCRYRSGRRRHGHRHRRPHRHRWCRCRQS